MKVILAQKDGKWGVLDISNHWLIQNKYEELGFFSEGLCPARYNGKWGYIDIDGNNIIPFQFEKASEFHNSYAPATQDGKKWGIIDNKGNFIVDPEYKSIDTYSDGCWMAATENDGMYDFIDSSAKVINCIYKNPTSFSGGFSTVFIEQGQKQIAGLMDHHGKVNSFGSKFSEIESFSYGVAVANTCEGKSVLIDQNGNVIYSAPGPHIMLERCASDKKYISLKFYPENLSRALIDYKGIMVCDTLFDEITNPFEGYSCIRVKDKWGVASISGKILIPAIYDKPINYSDEMILVNDSGKYGFLNKDNQFIIPPIYDVAQPFRLGISQIRLGDKAGAINKKGDIVVPIIYESVGSRVTNGYLSVQKNGKSGFVNLEGKEIIPLEYDAFSFDMVFEIKSDQFIDPLSQ